MSNPQVVPLLSLLQQNKYKLLLPYLLNPERFHAHLLS